MKLPDGIHRVTTRGRVYYYAWRGKGAPRLPDPEADPDAFWTAWRALQNAPEARDGTVAALVRDYRASSAWAKLKPATRKTYGWHLDRIVEMWGDFRAGDIQAAHVRAYRNTMEDRPTLANHALAIMRAAWAWGREHEWQLGDPAGDVKRLAVKTKGKAPWPAWALEIADQHFRPEMRRAVFLALYTGQRLSDVLAMRLADVEDGHIRVRQSKTGWSGSVPIHPELAREIDAARADGRLYMVSRPDGRPFTPQDWQALWTREMAKEPQAKIRKAGLSFHGLRKSAVVELARAGCSPVEIAAITGQSLAMVEHYLSDWKQKELAGRAMGRWAAHR